MNQRFALDPQEFFQEIDLRAFIRSAWYRRGQILAITVLCVLLAVLSVLGISSKSSAITSVQIEPEISTAGESSHIDTETKIVVSWPIVSEAVNEMGISAFVSHNSSFLGRATAPIRNVVQRKLMGSDKADEVTHSLWLDQFVVPEAYFGKTFTLKVIKEGGFILYDPHRKELLRGEVGVQASLAAGSNAENSKRIPVFSIRVKHVSADVGEEFSIRPLSQEDYIRALQKDLSADRVGVRNSNGIIDIVFKAEDPEFARRFLDTLVNVYAQRALQRSARGKIKALENLRLRNEQIERKLKSAEAALEKFREREKTINLPQESIQKIRLAADLQAKIGDLESEKAELLATRTEQNPSVVALKEQIASYRKQINEVELALNRMPEVERKLFQLTRDVATSKQLFIENSGEINRLTNEVAAITGYARVLNQAILEKNTMPIKVILAGIFGAVFAICGCLVTILIRNTAFFSVIRTPEMLKMGAKLPVIASIPRSSKAGSAIRKNRGAENMYLIDAGDAAALVLKDLEAKIKYITHGADNNVLLLTSDVENQGKSFIASNFALFSAENRRTLLIDADAVKGSLHFNFATLRSPGFSDLIVGEATLEQVLTNPVEGKLWFIPAGTALPSHNLLHDYEKLKSLMRNLSGHFDLIVIDYPALMSQIDNPEMLSFAGTIFLVVRQGESSSRVKRFLSKYPEGLAKVSAILLNDVVHK